jgi:hypothetical protein
LRLRVVLSILVVSALVLVGAVFLGIRALTNKIPTHLPSLVSQECVVTGKVDGQNETFDLSPEQMANAATIAAVGITRNVPPRAIVVALATALQESKLYNLDGGDRDSVGLFQQRPSQGWGSADQIKDPRYAAGRFYTALLKVKGWQQLTITQAAQKVQRSADGTLYQQWAGGSQVMTDAFSGTNGAALSCTITDSPAQRGATATAQLAQSLTLDWGQIDTVSDAAGTGLSVPVAGVTAGWQYAHWLVAHAAEQGVKSVTFGNRVWTAKKGSWSAPPSDATIAQGQQQVIAEVYA